MFSLKYYPAVIIETLSCIDITMVAVNSLVFLLLVSSSFVRSTANPVDDEEVTIEDPVEDVDISSAEPVDNEEVITYDPIEDEEVSTANPVENEKVSTGDPFEDEDVSIADPVEDEEIRTADLVEDEEISTADPVEDEKISTPDAVEDEEISTADPVEEEEVSTADPVEDKEASPADPVEDEVVSTADPVEDEEISIADFVEEVYNQVVPSKSIQARALQKGLLDPWLAFGTIATSLVLVPLNMYFFTTGIFDLMALIIPEIFPADITDILNLVLFIITGVLSFLPSAAFSLAMLVQILLPISAYSS